MSNVKEEVYGALDAFIAWDLEFPLITVKKALKTLEVEKEWKRVIQVTKWMLSKGQGRTMGSYFTLLSALAEEDRLEEAEELWTKLFSEHLESMPRMFFDRMIGIYYSREMHDKMFDVRPQLRSLHINILFLFPFLFLAFNASHFLVRRRLLRTWKSWVFGPQLQSCQRWEMSSESLG